MREEVNRGKRGEENGGREKEPLSLSHTGGGASTEVSGGKFQILNGYLTHWEGDAWKKQRRGRGEKCGRFQGGKNEENLITMPAGENCPGKIEPVAYQTVNVENPITAFKGDEIGDYGKSEWDINTGENKTKRRKEGK